MIINHDPEFVITLQRVIEFIGTFAFALSGIRLAASKHYDWLGGFVCGIAVASSVLLPACLVYGC